MRHLDVQTQTMSSTLALKEHYDKLLGRLRLSQTLNTGKAFLVTSASGSDGKTTVASNLAVAGSLAGLSVLLIGGAMPRCAGAVGLTDILAGSAAANQACFTSCRQAGLLHVLPPGKGHPTMLPSIDWLEARESFRSMSKDYDMTIVDAPPVLGSSDALLLAGLVDGILLVVDSASAHRNGARRAKEYLQQVGTPIIGAVLNRTNASAAASLSN